MSVSTHAKIAYLSFGFIRLNHHSHTLWRVLYCLVTLWTMSFWVVADAGTLTFNTVTDMKAYTTSTSGVTSITVLGYAAVGDMGAATYVPATGTFGSTKMTVKTGDGTSWMISDTVLRPEMMGGFPDNSTDCTSALAAAIMYGRTIYLQAGTYRLMSTCSVNASQMRTTSVNISGQGAGNTTINLANTSPYYAGMYFNYSGSSSQMLSTVTLSNFSIGRGAPDGYTGTIGPKSLYVAYANNVLLSGVEEYGAIGFGLNVAYSNQIEVKDCYVHDHKGGSTHLSGTDGIDIWYSRNINVHDNTIARVGDDGISFVGSVAIPNQNITCFNNTLTTMSGSIKVYGSVTNAEIAYNTATACSNGAVTIWLDSNNQEAGTISTIHIHDNNLTSSGGSGATGAVSVNAVGGTIAQNVSGIRIRKNTITNSPRGVSVFSCTPIETFSNVSVNDNIITGCGTGIFVGAVNTTLTVSTNVVQNSTAEGIAIALTNSSCVGMGSGTFRIQGNTVTNFMGGSSTGYTVRPGGLSIGSGDPASYIITTNTISDPQVSSPTYFGIYTIIGLSKATLLSNNPGIDLTNTKGVYSSTP